jgi:surface antigen
MGLLFLDPAHSAGGWSSPGLPQLDIDDSGPCIMVYPMASLKTPATYVLAAALFSLAGALIYFSVVLTRVLIALPQLTSEIQVTAEKIDPIVDEVHAIQEQIPLILDEVALIREQIPPILEQIPPILAEVEQIRLSIPPVLEETAEIRGAIPPILDEVTAYREQIPFILEEIDGIEQQIPIIVAEVDAVRNNMIPDIIEQVEAIRAEIPQHLDQAERISLNIETAGKKAGEGAVTGVFTGIVKAPMSIVSGIGGTVFPSSELNEQDRILIVQAAEGLIDGGNEGETVDWKNPDSGVRGKVSILEIQEASDPPCILIKMTAYRRYKKIGETNARICRDKQGAWEFIGLE